MSKNPLAFNEMKQPKDLELSDAVAHQWTFESLKSVHEDIEPVIEIVDK